MTARRPGSRWLRLAVGGAAAALTVLCAPVVGAPSMDGQAVAATPSADALTVTVTRISPWTPATTESKRALRFAVTLHNISDTDLTDVDLRLSRRVQPVYNDDELRSAEATESMPSDLHDIDSSSVPRSVDVAAGASPTVELTTFSGVPDSYPLCLCANAVYPLYVGAYNGHSGALEGFGSTYVASVDNAPDSNGNPFVKAGVAWVWPLIDRPHRTFDGSVFTDDALSRSISGGRLDRALQVVENVGSTTPITLMVDPDLIDELAVMSKGYTYRTSTGQTVTGQGGPAASRWLTRLRQVLTDDSQYVDLQFTPYADPAVQSLSGAGLGWRQLPPTMRARVATALGGLQTLPSTLSWPPGGRAGTTALDSIAAAGSTSVLIDNSSVKPSTVHGLPATSATLATHHGALAAGLLSSGMQDDVAATMSHPNSTLSRLPHLLAQLALLPDHEPYERRVAFLAPPRYVDPLPSTAEAVIRATTHSAFSTPLSMGSAIGQGAATAADRTRTRHLSDSTSPWSLTPAQLSEAGRTVRALPAAAALFGGANATPAALVALAQFPRALQRSESAAWTRASPLGRPVHGTRLTRQVRSSLTGLVSSVQIVRPRSGGYSYSLASNNSPLPVTVENDSPYRASVNIDLESADGLPGVSSNRLVGKTVAPQSKQTFRIQTRVQRSGRIQLFAVLSTPNGRVLGPRVRLSVHSTVFGTVGLVITVVAAVVLLAALGLRYFRRVQRLRSKRATTVASAGPAPAARASR